MANPQAVELARTIRAIRAHRDGVSDLPTAPAAEPRAWWRRQRRRILITLAVISFASLPLLPGLRPADFLARVWRMRWQMTSPEVLIDRLEKLHELGPAGNVLLVHALTDERAEVARHAALQLDVERQRWKELPLADASRSVAQVLNLLRRRVDDLSPEGYEAVGNFTRQVLRWPLDRAAVDEVEVVANSEEILTRLMALRAQKPAVTPAKDPLPPERSLVSLRSGKTGPPTEIELTPSQVGAVLTINDADNTAAALPDEPPQPPEIRLPVMSEMSDADVFDLLADPNAEIVLEAAAQLRRRGYNETTITLAERLLDPSAEVRIATAKQLAYLPGVEPRPWLLRLSRDVDVRVRRIAVSLMATSTDPILRRRLRELEATEHDAVILRHIEEALKQP